MTKQLTKSVGVVAAAVCGVVFPLALPSAFAQNVSGSIGCAGGPTHYAGVTYSAASANGGQIIFTNPSTSQDVVYDMWDYGDHATVYSPWNSTLWWVEASSVGSAVSACS